MATRVNHADILVQKLRKLIIKRVIKPHARLKETELAKTFGCSRVPVREAIHRLQREGLVHIRAGWGTYVPHLTRDEYIQAARVRAVLEDLIESVIIETQPPKLFRQLRNVINRMKIAAHANKGQLLDFYDLRFHRLMAESTQNPFLRSAFLRVAVPMILIDDTFLRTREDMERTASEHEDLLNALIRADLVETKRIRSHDMRYSFLTEEQWPHPNMPTRLGGIYVD